tara:strand:+ start:721 stop:975 length:255 start_codon:yes stop_codon:yes gene_type:complete
MKIYDMQGVLNPARVRIALAEKRGQLTQLNSSQLTFCVVSIAQRHSDPRTRTPQFLASNWRMAALYAQSMAITEYIDGHFEGYR